MIDTFLDLKRGCPYFETASFCFFSKVDYYIFSISSLPKEELLTGLPELIISKS